MYEEHYLKGNHLLISPPPPLNLILVQVNTAVKLEILDYKQIFTPNLKLLWWYDAEREKYPHTDLFIQIDSREMKYSTDIDDSDI